MASNFIKEVHTSLTKPPLKANGDLAKPGLTSLVKYVNVMSEFRQKCLLFQNPNSLICMPMCVAFSALS